MVIGLLLGFAMTVGVYLIVRTWRRWRSRPTPITEHCGWAEGPAWCDQQLTGRGIHTVVHHPDDAVEAELQGHGGTFVAQTFCKQHCPGACVEHRCRAKLVA